MKQPETALIVGAGSGLSASLARLFAKEGMRVALAARDTAKLASLVKETGAFAIACDAAEAEQVEAMFAALEAKWACPISSCTTRATARAARSCRWIRRKSSARSG